MAKDTTKILQCSHHEDFKSIFDHFLVLHTKGLKVKIKTPDGRTWHRSDLFIGPIFSS